MLDAFSVLVGLGVGVASTILAFCVCIPTQRGYQPIKRKYNEEMPPPKKSGVPPLVKVVKIQYE